MVGNEIIDKMSFEFRTNKSKQVVSCMFLITVVITIALSHERKWLDASITKVTKYTVNNDSRKESNRTTMKSELLRSIISTTRISPLTSKDVFNVKMKTDLMKIVNPSNPKFALTVNGSYLLENKDHCTSVARLTILIMVLSAPKNFQNRYVIRKTWANETLYSFYGTTRVLFLLGTINNSEVQRNIEKEFKLYGDIIQGSVVDSYRNLTHKTVMGYKWATERCRNAKYVIKTDDDIVINMFRVLQSDIAEMSMNHYHVHCLRAYKGDVIRDKKNRVYVEPYHFEGVKYYPPYCVGAYVMMLNDIVPYLYEAASKSPFFWIEDVFMNGIAMNNIPSLKYKQIQSDEYQFVEASFSNFLYLWKRKKKEWRYLFHITKNFNQMINIWSAIRKHYV